MKKTEIEDLLELEALEPVELLADVGGYYNVNDNGFELGATASQST